MIGFKRGASGLDVLQLPLPVREGIDFDEIGRAWRLAQRWTRRQ